MLLHQTEIIVGIKQRELTDFCLAVFDTAIFDTTKKQHRLQRTVAVTLVHRDIVRQPLDHIIIRLTQLRFKTQA